MKLLALIALFSQFRGGFASESASCVRYECELIFNQVETESGAMEDKAVLTCENYPFNTCGPGDPRCDRHCINRPGHHCVDNSDCEGLDEPKEPAPAPPAPVPVFIPVPADPPPGVCYHVAWPKKEECENLGKGSVPGQCYSSHAECSRAGGEQFLSGLCGEESDGTSSGCGCCLWPDDWKQHVPIIHHGKKGGTYWPTPAPTFRRHQEFIDVSKSNLQFYLFLFLCYIVFNATVILLSRYLLRRRSRLHGMREQQLFSGSYKGIEEGGDIPSAEGNQSDDDKSDEVSPLLFHLLVSFYCILLDVTFLSFLVLSCLSCHFLMFFSKCSSLLWTPPPRLFMCLFLPLCYTFSLRLSLSLYQNIPPKIGNGFANLTGRRRGNP
jgi:hypothetical protein